MTLNNPLVIFDCDGTIIDSMKILTDLATDTIALSYKVKADEAKRMYKSTVGIPFRDQLETLFPHDTRNSGIAEQYENGHRAVAPTFSLAPRLRILFKEIHARGYLRALVTSTDWIILRDWLPQVNRLGFHFMSGYLTGNDKLVQIDKAIKKLEADPSKTLYVGDSQFDQECAILSGIAFVKVTTLTLYDEVLYALERIDLL